MKSIERVLGLSLQPESTLGRINFSTNLQRISKWLGAKFEMIETTSTEEALRAVESYQPDLLVAGRFPDILLMESPIPLLILPVPYNLEALPIESLTVAISGEKKRSDALSLALRIANQTDSPVDLIHVTEPSAVCCCEACSMEKFPDEFQHEYPHMVEKVIAEGSPFSTLQERKHVRNFCHCAGRPGDELSDFAKTHPKSALVIEWKGQLGPGRATTLKKIVQDPRTPVFVVKTDHKPLFRLKVGGDFKAA